MGTSPVQNMSAVILAGGDSSRLLLTNDTGSTQKHFNKALLPWGDTAMLHHVARIYRSVFQDVIVLSNDPLTITEPGVLVLSDRVHSQVRSSKVGILNALCQSNSNRVCVGACDMPLVNREMLLLIASTHQDKDLVIPIVDHFLQPMPAVYNRSCIPILAEQIRQNNHRLLDFFGSVRIGLVDEEMLTSAGINKTVFININTWADYQMALKAAHLLN
jgi:molybdopterin-guanine dinucleotide biosynthesis protein A